MCQHLRTRYGPVSREAHNLLFCVDIFSPGVSQVSNLGIHIQVLCRIQVFRDAICCADRSVFIHSFIQQILWDKPDIMWNTKNVALYEIGILFPSPLFSMQTDTFLENENIAPLPYLTHWEPVITNYHHTVFIHWVEGKQQRGFNQLVARPSQPIFNSKFPDFFCFK